MCHNMHKYKRISYTSKRHRPPFDNDAIVGKASEISWDVGLRVLKVHKLGLGFPKVHKGIKGTRGSFNSTLE